MSPPRPDSSLAAMKRLIDSLPAAAIGLDVSGFWRILLASNLSRSRVAFRRQQDAKKGPECRYKSAWVPPPCSSRIPCLAPHPFFTYLRGEVRRVRRGLTKPQAGGHLVSNDDPPSHGKIFSARMGRTDGVCAPSGLLHPLQPGTEPISPERRGSRTAVGTRRRAGPKGPTPSSSRATEGLRDQSGVKPAPIADRSPAGSIQPRA